MKLLKFISPLGLCFVTFFGPVFKNLIDIDLPEFGDKVVVVDDLSSKFGPFVEKEAGSSVLTEDTKIITITTNRRRLCIVR